VGRVGRTHVSEFEPKVGSSLLEFGTEIYEAVTTVAIETPHGATITAG
jgi:hypothetical protein